MSAETMTAFGGSGLRRCTKHDAPSTLHFVLCEILGAFVIIVTDNPPYPSVSGGGPIEWQHLRAALCMFEEVGPILHHLGARSEVERVVVGGTDSVTRCVCKL